MNGWWGRCCTSNAVQMKNPLHCIYTHAHTHTLTIRIGKHNEQQSMWIHSPFILFSPNSNFRDDFTSLQFQEPNTHTILNAKYEKRNKIVNQGYAFLLMGVGSRENSAFFYLLFVVVVLCLEMLIHLHRPIFFVWWIFRMSSNDIDHQFVSGTKSV